MVINVDEIRRQIHLARKEGTLRCHWDISVKDADVLQFYHFYNYPMRGEVEVFVTKEPLLWRIDFYLNGNDEGIPEYIEGDYLDALREAEKYVLF